MMATHIIKVPDIGEGVAEVEVIKWHVGPGDPVAEDQGLVDIMTDKAAVEIPSPVRGKVTRINAKEGDVVAVGSDLLEIVAEDESTPQTAGDTQPMPSAVAKLAPLPATQSENSSRQVQPKTFADAGRAATLPMAAEAEEWRLDSGIPNKPLASPSVRQHARQAGIRLADVQGSGPGGRVTHTDLEALAHAGTDPELVGGRKFQTENNQKAVGSGKKQSSTGAVAFGEDGGRGAAGSGRDQPESADGVATPVIGLRRKIARNMQQAMQHIPHFCYVEEVDVTELEALRARLNLEWEQERGHLTLLPFVLRAMALAIRDYPQVNAIYDDTAQTLTHYAAVNAGIATDTPAGLVVPVVRHVEGRSLWSCASEIARLAEQARAGRITREDLGGSTISLTNLGALGGIVSTPIVNYPQVAIVGLNKIAQRPVVVSGDIVVRKIMNMSSSFDHRIIDGAYAAGFIQAARGYLECPATLFIE